MCRLIVVSGSVQGVGYRAFARRAALALGIRGHAINLPDGRVEVLACGETAALDAFVTQLRAGPQWSRVTDVSVSAAECTAQTGFGSG
ncbi:MAG: acylphosphatase [Pseudomonadales bacterium]|nr:acylphosphatase [Pseudomonadales bacterium]MBP9033357.1 acylphosphatase [Pseudomonadales bacterium]